MQLNLHVTPEFERALRRFMRARRLTNRSEAIRVAVAEAAERATRNRDWASLLGAALDPAPPTDRPPLAEDDLWK